MRGRTFNIVVRMVCAMGIIGLLFMSTTYARSAEGGQGDEVAYVNPDATDEWMQYGGVLHERLLEVLPKTDFGGVWINDMGRVQIGLVDRNKTSDNSRNQIIAEARTIGISDGIDIVPVKNSWAALSDARDEISQLSQNNIRYQAGEWPIQVGIKTDQNKVQVDIPSNKKKLVQSHEVILSRINASHEDMVFFEEYNELPREEAECNSVYCDSPLRGGVVIKRSDDNPSGDRQLCTAGFIIKELNSSNRFILTAGHCAAVNRWWITGTRSWAERAIGSVPDGYNLLYYVEPVDAMMIKVEPINNWGVVGAIFKRGGASGMGLNGFNPPSYDERYEITGARTSVVGERICVSPGITGSSSSAPTGGSCGKVHQVEVALTTSSGKTTIVNRAGYCSRGGDSGSPVVDGWQKAHGIHRAANILKGTCSDWKYYTPMSQIINKAANLGIRISLY